MADRRGVIAQGRDGFQGQVARALNGPLVVLFEQNGAEQIEDGRRVCEDADDLGPALDLAIEAAPLPRQPRHDPATTPIWPAQPRPGPQSRATEAAPCRLQPDLRYLYEF
jgi:hypothetical protein